MLFSYCRGEMKLYYKNETVKVNIKIKKEVKLIIESLLKKYPNDQNYHIQEKRLMLMYQMHGVKLILHKELDYRNQ